MRPQYHLAAAGKMYPNAWRQVNIFRKSKGKDLPDWPSWCFLPMAATYSIVSEGGAMAPERLGDVAKLAALIAWRYTQGIYKFEPSVYESISTTVVKNDIPVDVLYRLPEWGVYIETPGLDEHGFFAHLEYDINTHRSELRLLIDSEEALYPIILHLGQHTVTEAIDRALSEAAKQGNFNKQNLPIEQMIEHQSKIAQHCISLLLYLCSEEPDITRIENELPQRPSPKKVKGDWKLFPPQKAKTWRIGEKIAEEIAKTASQDQGGTHKTPTPHIRRAHWHGYWTGERAGQDRKFIYKWLPPLIINATSN
ncbi:hypothetical protein V6259_12930 [Marinomonas sp. TI.3.20]|uniref:AcrVA2 family anti-CRISPR protein n=1 Tax=Marinomonas sp. TI.3.20 TaxID=3121296 RepID=UPI00311D66C1